MTPLLPPEELWPAVKAACGHLAVCKQQHGGPVKVNQRIVDWLREHHPDVLSEAVERYPFKRNAATTNAERVWHVVARRPDVIRAALTALWGQRIDTGGT